MAYVAPEPEADDPLLAFVPYLHTAPRRNSITPDLQRRFVATLATSGIVKQAAKSIGRSLEALYKLRHRPGAEGFAAAWDAALDRGVQRLEDCALERAVQGTATPIVSQGQILGWWDKPDNALLRFLLRYRLPQKYGTAAEGLKPGHPAYDALAAAMEAKVGALGKAATGHSIEQAMAIHTFRLRRLQRTRNSLAAAGQDPSAVQDAWDNYDENGLPCLDHKSGVHYGLDYDRAQKFLDELEAHYGAKGKLGD